MIIDQIASAAVHESANHVTGEEVVRKAELDRAGVREPAHMFRREFEFERVDVVLRLLEISRADDGYHYAALLPHPIDSHLRG